MPKYIRPFYVWLKVTKQDDNTMSRAESYEFQPWQVEQKKEFVQETDCEENPESIFWSEDSREKFYDWLEQKYQ